MFLCNNIKSQTYLDTTVRWHCVMQGMYLTFSQFSFFTIYLDGDTVFGGTTYWKRFYIRRDSTIDWMHPNNPPVINTSQKTFFYGIREDSGRFYTRYDSGIPEELLNDFNIQIGDTFTTNSFDNLTGNSCQYDTVSSIDTVWFSTTPLKRFRSDGTIMFLSKPQIEGIGYTGNTCDLMISEGSRTMTCYSRNGITLELDTAYGGCSNYYPAPIWTNINSTVSNKYKIISNDGILSIKNIDKKTKIDIYNILGSKIYSNVIYNNCDINLNTGIYIIKLNDIIIKIVI